MLDKIQFLLSLQILGFCFFGGLTLLLKARDNRAKQILGWSMLLWAFLAAVRVSVNLYVNDSKEVFHPDVLVTGCLVSASLACYVIEVLRPRYLTLKRFLLFISPLLISGLSFFIYRLAGGEIHVYYSLKDVFVNFDLDMFLRLVLLLFTLIYMTLPVYLVLKYSKEFTKYLSENVSNPEDYDLNWLKKIMVILVILYVFYLVLLLTDKPILYVIDKAILLIVWYYFFYKALFLKVIELDHSFEKGWDLSYCNENDEEDDEQHSMLTKRYVEDVYTWFEREKPYLREDLRLTDLQRVFPISRSYLSQLFNKELGCSFSDYVNSFRIEESKRLLEAEPMTSIQEIAERSGFHSISTFRRAFIKCTGMMPSEYRK
ncbi:helix-turn-helix domain-containing protein [Parabacteroides bouchesdurhonensis]|uniref:helix-turn-helix domain-containing protein n=1 Tax=Parabacteroides bouchesdurhonensis TaxID=1936995 RepID=UPI000C816C1E|nr:helix-turn-helix domain-containing protein [Parabacteroides bouchesdurhonensis]